MTPRGSLSHHLSDLRCCLWRSIVGIAACTVLCLALSEPILAVLRIPIQRVLGPGQRLVVLSVHEYVLTQLRAAIAGGLLLSSPWVLTQVWYFVAPGLYRREKRTCLAFVGAGSACAIVGVSLGYFFGLPLVFAVLAHGLPPGIDAAYSVGHLFGFAVNTLLVCAAVCETPVVVFLLVVSGIVRVPTLVQYRRHVIVGAFILGAVVTPPDPLTQILVALPFVALYEAGLAAARMFVSTGGKK